MSAGQSSIGVLARTSPDVAAARHLARAYGVSMRRRRTNDRLVFDLGLLTSRSVATGSRAYGELSFDDDGRLDTAQLFGTPLAGIDMMQLASILEHGPSPETSTTLVLSAAPEALIAPIRVDDPITGPIQVVPELVPASAHVPRRALARVPRVVSVPVYNWAAAAASSFDFAQVEAREAIRAAFPKPWLLWLRLFAGLALSVQFAAPMLLLSAGATVSGEAATLSALTALLGLLLTGTAVRTNDRRERALAAAS